MVAPSMASGWETVIPGERERLVRLCAHLSGDPDAAEDLAQETLIEAWRNAHKLHDPSGREKWLAAIARNVCLRWMRRQGREAVRYLLPSSSTAGAIELDTIPDTFDLEVELEQNELTHLLDRALALLPPQTRAVLIERYVEQSPLAEVASQLGMSEGAVAMRIQRGKLQLRKVLSEEFRQETSAYGLSLPDDQEMRTTQIWCPICGSRRLVGRFVPASGELLLRCPQCTVEPNTAIVNGCEPTLLQGLHTLRPALTRLTTWAYDYFQRALAERTVPCTHCGRDVTVSLGTFEETARPFEQGITLTCGKCGMTGQSALCGIVLCQPAPWRFWREHPRMRMLERPIEFEGRQAIVVSLESATGHARMDVITSADTFEVLGIYGDVNAN
jgi:RNA polymerase sigma factor (sigma-70 family)